MDIFEFIAAVIEHGAWPTVTLICFFTVIVKFPTLVRAIKSIRYKDFEITVRDQLIDAQITAENIQPKELAPRKDELSQIAKFAGIDTSVAVVAVWMELEGSLNSLIQHNGLVRFTNPLKFIEHLFKLKKISTEELELFQKLRTIRNLSVHAREEVKPTIAEVLEYKRLVDLLLAKFEEIKNESGYIDMPTN